MIADFQRMAVELEREIQTEQDRAGINDPAHFAYPTYAKAAIQRARRVMATHADMEELIRLGAYRSGSSPEVDEAIRLHDPLETFLRQAKDEVSNLADGYRQLEQILGHLETES
jgi:flagellar biosynthesis/type III secretory pathway ATPase